MLEVSQGIGLKDLVEAFYFRPDQIGGLEAMTPGLIDFESAFFIKATAYQVGAVGVLRLANKHIWLSRIVTL